MTNQYPPTGGDPSQPGQQQPYYPPPGNGQQYGQQPGGWQGQPQYPGQPAPGPAPKKKRKWPWILGVLVVLLIIIIAVGQGGSSDSGDSGSSSDNANSAPADDNGGESSAGLNTPVRDGKFEFVVSNVEGGLAEVGENEFLREQAQGQFVIVSMSVKNISDEPQSFDPSSQKLKDTEGRTFEPDTTAQIALGGSDVPVWDNINPGNAVDVKVVYDMPQGAVPASVDLHDSMFSGGVEVSLQQ